MAHRNADVRSCLESNARWRREAASLRAHAGKRGLADQQRACLAREAYAADRQADMWLRGAIEHA